MIFPDLLFKAIAFMEQLGEGFAPHLLGRYSLPLAAARKRLFAIALECPL